MARAHPTTGSSGLEPIFGSRCRTRSFSRILSLPPVDLMRIPEDLALLGEQPAYSEYIEAFIDHPVHKTWSLSKVVTITPVDGGPQVTETRTLETGLNFKSAIDKISAYERLYEQNTKSYTADKPNIGQLAFSHFKAFAEREGYVFDYMGFAHERPHPEALPANASFLQEDIVSANRNLQRKAEEFSNHGPHNKAPNPFFLFDSFNRKSSRNHMEEKAAEARILAIFENFVKNVRNAHDCLDLYCKTYEELGKGDLIESACTHLDAAERQLRQLEAYKVDTEIYVRFVRQSKIMCHVIHAQGLYDLMHKDKGDFFENEATFKSRCIKAADEYHLLDPTNQHIDLLHEMILYAPRPEVPKAIGHFLQNYDREKLAFQQARGGENQAPSKTPPPGPSPKS